MCNNIVTELEMHSGNFLQVISRKEKIALSCANREFREEIGYNLQGAKETGSFYLQPSKSNQVVHMFKGTVGKYNPVEPDNTESIESKFFSFEEVWKKLSKKPSAMHILAFLLQESKKRKLKP